VRIFARIGLGQWFRVATGLIEVAGGALLILPITKRLGAAVLAITMVGACVAHITVLHDPLTSIVPAVLGGIAVVVGLDEPCYDMRQLWLKRSNPVSPPSPPTEGTKQ
jgi:putative oxidoreductase